MTFQPGWLPLAMGSLPYTDARKAWDAVLRYFPVLPGWPQLPRRAALENMYAQFSERFPGITIRGARLIVDRKRDLDADLERLYLAYLENDLSHGEIGAEHAAGLALLLHDKVVLPPARFAVKGQITGPISWGLTIVDQNQRPVLYDEVLEDAVGKHLCLKAAWQEQKLRRFGPQTIMFLDEPYLASFGSAFVSLGKDQVTNLLEEVLASLKGLKGIHCCGNTDWSLLLDLSVDIVSLDAYDYCETLALYPDAVTRFLKRGGVLSWGIVPASSAVETESVQSLADRLHAGMDLLVAKGVSRDDLLQAGLITPSCGVGTVKPELAERVFELTVGVAAEMRRRYVDARVEDSPEEAQA
ncbi:MAG: uroporphyrinogen decarboxylase/cobalamine-independent methonine synthase family protein [Anaerolineae bacterium]